MTKYVVFKNQVGNDWTRARSVEANSLSQAKRKAIQNAGDDRHAFMVAPESHAHFFEGVDMR